MSEKFTLQIDLGHHLTSNPEDVAQILIATADKMMRLHTFHGVILDDNGNCVGNYFTQIKPDLVPSP